MGFVLEMDLGLVELAEALDEAQLVGIDEDVGDGRVLEQRLDRTIAGHLVDDLFGEQLELALIERNLLGAHVVGHIGGDLLDQLRPRQLLEHGQIEFIDDAVVQLELLFEQRRTPLNQILVEAVGTGDFA